MPRSEVDEVGPVGEVELVGGEEQPEREQQGVTGQEREQQPALDEDDDQADQTNSVWKLSSSQLGSIHGIPRSIVCRPVTRRAYIAGSDRYLSVRECLPALPAGVPLG